MTREIVILPDDVETVTELMYGGKNPDWEWIEEENIGVDLEKGIKDMRVVLQRTSDGKYFAFEFARTNYHQMNEPQTGNRWPLQGKEVFLNIIQKEVYI